MASGRTVGERREEVPERAAAVRQRVLLVVGHLGERAAVAVVGDEHRVVPEAALAPLVRW
jgi:hypothetical protein